MAEFGEELSERELEVLQCLIDGSTNKEIAGQLFISQNTVKVHLRNVYTKLGVASRTEATTLALQQKLITLPGEAPPPIKPEVDEEIAAETETAVPPAPPSEETAVLPTPTPPINPSHTGKARTAGFVGVGLLLALLVGYLGWQAWPTEENLPATATLAPFVEEQIGDSLWRRGRPLEEPKMGVAVAAVGLNVYEIGGETAVGVSNEVRVYDTAQRIWQTAPTKPTAVADATAAVLYGEIYVAGGRLADGTETAVVEAYSPTNRAWRPVAALPQPVSGGLTLSDGSFLYFLGGYSRGRALDDAYVYDPSADSWRPLASLPEPRAYAAGGTVANQLYIVGGEDGETVLASCHSFDLREAEWHECPPMLLPRSRASATDLLNKLYVLGGEVADSGQAVYSEVYDPANEIWQVVNTPMLTDQPAWQSLGVTHIENRIYALGGRRGDQLVDDNLIYTPFVYQTFIPAAVSD